ncbi:Alpha/Beta hydrolase protein [Russula compacta]|nr:Alpha/Beta hydrolase protein [Russula compacta]
MRLSIPVLLVAAATVLPWTPLLTVFALPGLPTHPPSSPQPPQSPLLPSLPLDDVHGGGGSSSSSSSRGDEDGVSMNTYAELEHFAKYASAVYHFFCLRPLGNKLVQTFSNVLTHAHGFVARDDKRCEIVVAFRGSHELADMFTDGNLMLAPLASRGIQNNTASVHCGFLISYNSVRTTVIRTVHNQLRNFPGYVVVVTGHSMGGALASIAALSIKSNIPTAEVRLFTFGQPRTGDAAYADLLEITIGRDNIFRAVHTWDGVPTMIPEALGYHHHAREYWQFQEPRKFFSHYRMKPHTSAHRIRIAYGSECFNGPSLPGSRESRM